MVFLPSWQSPDQLVFPSRPMGTGKTLAKETNSSSDT